jgi:hypothetical protein
MTVLRYETLARRFLAARVTPTDELGVTDLDGAVVARFLLGECGRVCLGSARGRSRSCGRCCGSRPRAGRSACARDRSRARAQRAGRTDLRATTSHATCFLVSGRAAVRGGGSVVVARPCRKDPGHRHEHQAPRTIRSATRRRDRRAKSRRLPSEPHRALQQLPAPAPPIRAHRRIDELTAEKPPAKYPGRITAIDPDFH